MSTPYVIAFIYPKADKLEQILEIVGDLISSVKENEPNTLRYEWYKSVDESGSPRVTVIEKYASKDAFDSHCKNPKLGEALQKITTEGLVAADAKIEVMEMVAGFTR